MSTLNLRRAAAFAALGGIALWAAISTVVRVQAQAVDPAATQDTGQQAGDVGRYKGGAESPAQAEVDTERMELQNEYRRKGDQLADIERQIDALTKAQGDAPLIGEEAVRAFDERNQKAVKLQVERHKLAEEIDKVRARYADLERRALKAYGGQLPSWWEELPDLP